MELQENNPPYVSFSLIEHWSVICQTFNFQLHLLTWITLWEV